MAMVEFVFVLETFLGSSVVISTWILVLATGSGSGCVMVGT